MKLQDIAAISKMDPKNHIYLKVTGSGADKHLEQTHKGWRGRIWMHFGFGSATMDKVARYIVEEKVQFKAAPQVDLTLLIEKLDHYQQKHSKSKFAKKAHRILVSIGPTKAASKEKSLPPTSSEADKKVQIINEFIEKFNASPEIYPMGLKTKPELRDLYHQEVDKLEAFLSTESTPARKSEQDLIYICIGHGSSRVQDSRSDEQVWPRFIFNALKNNQKVQTVLIEKGWKYPSHHITAYRDMVIQYEKGGNKRQEIQPYLNNFSVQEFLCGFPSKHDEAEDSLTPNKKALYDHPTVMNLYWKQQAQISKILNLFHQYLEKQLSEGKQVVLGDHTGHLSMRSESVSLYNSLIAKYPTQLHLLWGWGGANLITNKLLSKLDIKVEGTPAWVHHDHLSTCTLG